MTDQRPNLDDKLYGPWPIQFLGWTQHPHMFAVECRYSTMAYNKDGQLLIYYCQRFVSEAALRAAEFPEMLKFHYTREALNELIATLQQGYGADIPYYNYSDEDATSL